jgi:hypothetical protein
VQTNCWNSFYTRFYRSWEIPSSCLQLWGKKASKENWCPKQSIGSWYGRAPDRESKGHVKTRTYFVTRQTTFCFYGKRVCFFGRAEFILFKFVFMKNCVLYSKNLLCLFLWKHRFYKNSSWWTHFLKNENFVFIMN